MKKLIGAVAVAIVIATPALAQTVQRDPAQPRTTVRQPATQQAPSANQRHSSNPANDVYDNGRYLGSDPDVFIRGELRRDSGMADSD